MKRFLFCLFVILVETIYSQPVLTDYKEEENNITLKIHLDRIDLLDVDNAKQKIIKMGFFNENKEGEYALPVRDIFVGIPFSKIVNLKTEILKENVFNYELGFNPSTTFVNDSLIKYDFFNNKKIRKNNYNRVVLLGCFWSGNIYTAHLQIEQYLYNDAQKTVNEITDLNIILLLDKRLTSKNASLNKPNYKKNLLLINRDYCDSYQVNRANDLRNDSTGNWFKPNKFYIKLGTYNDGIYRFEYSDFQKLDINPLEILPETINIYNKGKTIPIYINGEEDHSFDQGDFIEFIGLKNMGGKHKQISNYNEPYNEYLDRYSDTTIYWLTWQDNNPPNRVLNNSASIVSIPPDTLSYYSHIEHVEQNNYFDYSTEDNVRRENPYWIENKTWGWNAPLVGESSYNFPVSDIYLNQKLKIWCKLQSYASSIRTNSHELSFKINNGNPLDTFWVNKYEQVVLYGEENSNNLVNGTNKFKLTSFPTESSVNRIYFDWVEVEYPRYNKLINDSLILRFNFLSAEKENVIKLQNRISSDFSIWKYGKTIEKYSDYVIAGNNILFVDTIKDGDVFLANSSGKISKPKIFYKKEFINLRSNDRQADYIAITNKKFVEKSKEYVNFIADNYKLSVTLIDIEDLYDEFSFGYFNPEVTRDFLKVAYDNWKTPSPKFVLLIGGTTYDYLYNKVKYQSQPQIFNNVPSFGAPVSDNWFVTWDSSGIYNPRMNIGRIPIKTNEELDHYLEKHKNYIKNNYDDWNKKYLFFSGGNADNTQEVDQLRKINESIIDNYVIPKPIGGIFNHFYKTINPVSNFGPNSDKFHEAVSEGSIFISYLGHSGTQTWDNSIVDPAQLENDKNRNSLITDFGCSTAKFAEPDIVSFSQLFVTSLEGQAIAYIGNSSLGFTSTSYSFPQIFYRKILRDSILNIGEAHRLAKIELLQKYGYSGTYSLFALTNILIGDPVINLPIPLKPNLTIKNKNISYSPALPSDNLDSIRITISYNNFGRVPDDSLYVEIKHVFNDSTLSAIKLKREIPLFIDSIEISISIQKKAGLHKIYIELDPDNKVDELNETDNFSSVEIVVTNSELKPLLSYQNENSLVDYLNILNPIQDPFTLQLSVELADKSDFINSNLLTLNLDTVFTRLSLNSLPKNIRYFIRGKLINNDSYSFSKSFFNGLSFPFLINDTISIKNASIRNLKVKDNISITIDITLVKFELISAGLNDGKTAVISKDGENYVSMGNVIGHHVCVFEDSTFRFVTYKLFNVYGGGTSVSDAYYNFLDTLSNKYLLMIAISDEGRVNTKLAGKLKEFGSIYIDSLKFRSSWAFIGKRGSLPGKLPESYSLAFSGRVKIDTTIKRLSEYGYLLTNKIGPSSRWKSLRIIEDFSTNSVITYRPIIISPTKIADTLEVLKIENNSASLEFINAVKYPYLKILAEFKTSTDGTSPTLSSLGVDYTGVPELATNYQVASSSKDSLVQGDSTKINFYVYNVGETPADSFNVKLLLVKPDNSQRQLFDSLVVRLDSMSRKYFTYNYHSNSYDGYGKMTFRIAIDDSNKILELYEDNNVYDIPVQVAKDTTSTSVTSASLVVTYDGIDIIDGDYVAPDPEINMTLSYPVWFPVNDSVSVQIYLDGEKVNYSNLKIFSDTINRKLVLTYLPSLTDGEHRLRVYGQNIIGNIEDNPGYEKIFYVSNEMNLLDVFNYPNPFKDNTSFTFKLSQIPDEFKIKIYTVAGRLIKEFVRSSSELKYDFNQIQWDGRDEDGNLIANGVYLYRIQVKKGDKQLVQTQKLAIVR